MKLSKLSLGPFRSYAEATSLDLSGKAPGLYLVAGDNGAGKSTLFDALYWAAYGSTPRGLRAGNVSPWVAEKKGARVSVSWADGPELFRSWSPNALRLAGVEVDQTKVDDAFGSSLSALNTWYFSQLGSYFVDLPAPDRMALYAEALALTLWDRKAADASALAKSYGEDTRTAATETARAREALETLSAMDIEGDYARWEQEREAAVVEFKDRLETLEAREEGARKGLQSAKASLRALEDSVGQDKTAQEATARALRARSEAETALEIDTREEAKLVKAVAAAAGLGSKCNHCGQDIPPSQRKKHLEALRVELEEVRARSAQAGVDVSKARLAWERAREREQAAEQKAREGVRKARQAVEQAQDGYNVAEGFAEACRRELAACRGAGNPFEAQRRQHARNLQAALGRLSEAEAGESALQEQVSQFEFWAKGFKDIRLQILKDSLAQLNAEVNEALHDLGLEGWRIDFEVEQETKSGGVRRGFLCAVSSPQSPEGLAVPWEAWSGGESQALRVAIQLGTANMLSDRLGLSNDFEFWDEPSRWLREMRVKDLLGVLQERAYRYGRRVFVAEHRSLDFDFDGVLEVSKVDGVSTLSWG